MIGIALFLMIVFGFLRKKNLLLPAALLAATFPASSVLNASAGSSFSIAPFWLVALAIFGHFIFGVYPRAARYGPTPLGRVELILVVAFCWTIVVSLLAPPLFKGIEVFSPRAGIDLQVGNLTELSFGISNIAQAGYALLLLVFVLYFCRSRVNLLVWLKATFAIAAFFGLYQILHDRYGIPFPNELIYNNQGVTVANNQRIGSFLRINSTFTEPSMAGAFFAAGTVAMFISRSYVMASICFLGVLFSTSSAGYLSLALFLIFILFRKVYKHLKNYTVAVKFIAAGLVGLLCGLIALQGFGLGDVLIESTLRKTGTLSFANRTASDLHALVLVFQTFGLGVGMGSNRPSSFFTFLLSNIGIFGTALFTLCFFLVLIRKTAPWARWGLATYLTAKFIGIPDFSDPWLWIWFSLAFSVPAAAALRSPSPSRSAKKSGLTQGTLEV